MTMLDPFPDRRTEQISREKGCGLTNLCDVTQPFLRLAMRRFGVIESAREPMS